MVKPPPRSNRNSPNSAGKPRIGDRKKNATMLDEKKPHKFAKARRTSDGSGQIRRGPKEQDPEKKTWGGKPWDEKAAENQRPSASPKQSPPKRGTMASGKAAQAAAAPKVQAAAERRKPLTELRPEGGVQRIAKLMARAGVASRREIERMIEDRRIAINGVTLDTPATLLENLNGVTVDGEPVGEAEQTRLFLFHKPVGYLTAERDFTGRNTIYDALPKDLPRVMPIGRLDLNTEGLLLLTNDGGLKRQMELPSSGVERTYRARAFGEVSQAQLEELIEGVTVEGMHYGKIDANLERRTGLNQWIEMTLTEGKNREVRRVLEYLGLRVNRLIRLRYGPFFLGDLAVGEVGEVSEKDLARFVKALNREIKTAATPNVNINTELDEDDA